MTSVGMHEAKTTLSKLVALAEAGEDVVIERRGQPVARIVKYEKPKISFAELRGIAKDEMWIADDFNAPMPGLEALVYGDAA